MNTTPIRSIIRESKYLVLGVNPHKEELISNTPFLDRTFSGNYVNSLFRELSLDKDDASYSYMNFCSTEEVDYMYCLGCVNNWKAAELAGIRFEYVFALGMPAVQCVLGRHFKESSGLFGSIFDVDNFSIGDVSFGYKVRVIPLPSPGYVLRSRVNQGRFNVALGKLKDWFKENG